MTTEKIIQMIDEYLEEPHSINKDWVQALEICKKAVEKQIPKKAVANSVIHHCPSCNNVVIDIFKHSFCDRCGQALDWSENDETNTNDNTSSDTSQTEA